MLEHIKKTICKCLIIANRLECDLITDTNLLPEPDTKVIYSGRKGRIHHRESCIENLIFPEGLSRLLGQRMNGIKKRYVPFLSSIHGIKRDRKIGRRTFQPFFPFAENG